MLNDKARLRRVFKSTGLVLACWTFAALLFTPQTYIANSRAPTPLTWGQSLWANLVLFYTYAAMTPLAFWLGRRFPLGPPRPARNFAVLFALGFPVAAAHLFVLGQANELLLPALREYVPPAPVLALVLNVGATSVLVYWGIIAVGHAVTYFRKYRAQELDLARAQLHSLKMQLHPHFLFNTLNAVSELVYEAPEQADRAITQLSDLLRISLRTGETQEVTLKEELDFLAKYVAIQQTLMQERLDVRWDVDDGTLDACVPNMLLQPLVENSIRHGLAPRKGGGRIEVVTRRRGEVLHLRVSDDGLGLPRGAGNGVARKGGSGVGLSNTRERLQHLYDGAQRFELSQTPGGGLTVCVAIPFREKTAGSNDEDSDADS